MVWAESSDYLAVPQWNFETQDGGIMWYERIIVVSVRRNLAKYLEGKYKVLELHSFSNNIIKGIESPAYDPKTIEIDVSRIVWD